MRTAASILILSILVPCTLVVFLVSSVKANVLTAEFIKHELAAQKVYTIAEDQASQQIAKMKFENLPINAADLQTLVQRVLPASWLQMNIESTLDRTFAWFNGPSDATLALPIDLRGPKSELLPGVDALIAAAIPRLPVCQRHQKEGELCRTTGMSVAQVKDLLKQGGIDVATVTTQLPDEIDLANPVLPTIKLGNAADPEKEAPPTQDTKSEQTTSVPDQAKNIVAQMTNAKEIYHQVLGYWNDALIVFGVLVLGYLAINAKGWRRITRWTGILTLTLGFLPLAVSVASKVVMEKYLLPSMHFTSDIPAAVQTAVPAAIRDFQHALFSTTLLVSAVMVAFGVVAIVGAHFIPARKPATSKK